MCGSDYNFYCSYNYLSNQMTIPSYSLTPVPCTPVNISSHLNCPNRTVQLSWSPSANAVTYIAKAKGPTGESLHCNSSSPDCLLGILNCGQAYNLTVAASNGVCDSPYSTPIRQDSGNAGDLFSH